MTQGTKTTNSVLTLQKFFYFPSWFHRTHTLKTWQRHPTPLPPEDLFEATEKIAEGSTTRKKIIFPIFFNWSSGYLEITFFWLPWPKKTQYCQKLLLNIQKKTQFRNFFRKFFFHRLLWTRESSFDNIVNDFRQVTENFRQIYEKWYIFFSYKNCFSSNLSTWDVERSFNKPLKNFRKKVEFFLLKSEFFLEKPMILDFFSGHVKNSFWKSFRTKLPKSEILSILVWNHEQKRSFQRILCPTKCSFGEASGIFNNPDKWFLPEGRKIAQIAKKLDKNSIGEKNFSVFSSEHVR